VESVSHTIATLQGVALVEDLLSAAASEIVPSFKHLEFEFLLEGETVALDGSRSSDPDDNSLSYSTNAIANS